MGLLGAKQLLTSSQPHLTIVSGFGVGQVFELNQNRITIGRSDDNIIILSGDGVSRHHATIEKDANGYFYIRDHQSKNGVILNQTRTEASQLVDGDLIQVGSYAFRFSSGVNNAVSLASPEAPLAVEEAGGIAVATPAKKNKRILLYGLLGLVAAVMFLNQSEENKDSKKKTAETEKETEKIEPPVLQKEKPIDNVRGLQDPVQSSDPLSDNPNLREAEQFFKKGEREYTNKNYHRAIEAFQAALAIFPRHRLAGYYYKLASYEAEQEAKTNFDLANQYFKSLQYQRAIYHYEQVIQLLQHKPTGDKIEKSKKYIEECRRKLQEAELYP